MRSSRKLTPLTGDPVTDAFTKMRNNNIRKERARAPMEMNKVEEELIRNILPKRGIARIVTNSKQSAQYVKVRLRKILTSYGWNEMVATSQQDSEIIIWRIADYNQWRIKPPIENSQMWKDSRAEDVTFFWEYSKTNRSSRDDKAVMEKTIERMSSKSKWDGIDIDAFEKIITGNFEANMITKDEYIEKMMEIDKERERRNDG